MPESRITRGIESTEGETSGTQSIRRAVATLRILAMRREGGAGLTEIARLSGQSHPTTHRILKALIAEGLVERRAGTRRYALGEQIRLLALSRPTGSRLLATAGPVLHALATELGDTIFLTQRSGLDTVCIARWLGSFPIQVTSLNVGDRRPLGVSSAGIIVLAQMSQHEVGDILAQNEPRLQGARFTAGQARAHIAAARRNGYALRDQGLVPGTKALSVAIRDTRGNAYAAITMAGLTRRLSPQRLPRVVERLLATADQIETTLNNRS